ncbi:hypothetical protein MBEHAL_1026 [Halarchaeum acidiphilum MH1-52-1]|uniref:Uncharacterized protein n=1 Tax=Halarchaeum acidiphilum MH1-52-1 TaxID=1261545 RepID=U2YEL7_9EURY|nr:hypothetical protein [Halarchaeum acidiphilum]GAD52266.1 hypothetical protein MBEHAL_1026 [Halarchaeum acidiphilum MH1-52-1]
MDAAVVEFDVEDGGHQAGLELRGETGRLLDGDGRGEASHASLVRRRGAVAGIVADERRGDGGRIRGRARLGRRVVRGRGECERVEGADGDARHPVGIDIGARGEVRGGGERGLEGERTGGASRRHVVDALAGRIEIETGVVAADGLDGVGVLAELAGRLARVPGGGFALPPVGVPDRALTRRRVVGGERAEDRVTVEGIVGTRDARGGERRAGAPGAGGERASGAVGVERRVVGDGERDGVADAIRGEGAGACRPAGGGDERVDRRVPSPLAGGRVPREFAVDLVGRGEGGEERLAVGVGRLRGGDDRGDGVARVARPVGREEGVGGVGGTDACGVVEGGRRRPGARRSRPARADVAPASSATALAPRAAASGRAPRRRARRRGGVSSRPRRPRGGRRTSRRRRRRRYRRRSSCRTVGAARGKPTRNAAPTGTGRRS